MDNELPSFYLVKLTNPSGGVHVVVYNEPSDDIYISLFDLYFDDEARFLHEAINDLDGWSYELFHAKYAASDNSISLGVR